MTYNLFRRAGVVPFAISPAALFAVSHPGFTVGEVWLKELIDVLRHQATGNIACGSQSVPDKLDCVDQDMNSTVMLWMSRYALSTLVSETAISSYRSRAHSYGSFFGKYCETYGPLIVSSQCQPGDSGCCLDKKCVDSKLI